ncbi:MAG: succinate dehydrogenase [Oscillospiraceae bacterium]|nr:succinate dehydrogenase [Oscillospiraceae bacterium]
MKFLLRVLVAPVRLVIWLVVRLFVLVTYISSFAFGIASGVVAVLAILVLLTGSVKNGVILLVIAFLVSPLGLPMLAVKLVGLLNRLGCALGDLART